MKKLFLGTFSGIDRFNPFYLCILQNWILSWPHLIMAKNFKEHIRMSLEFGLLKCLSAKIKPSGIPNSLLSTNVAGIIPVILGSTAQSVLVFQLLNLDFNVQ
jgi:hypothetical protein